MSLHEKVSKTLELVPEEQKELKHHLTHLQTSLIYTAPELYPNMWLRFCNILTMYLPDAKENVWVLNVQNILTEGENPIKIENPDK